MLKKKIIAQMEYNNLVKELRRKQEINGEEKDKLANAKAKMLNIETEYYQSVRRMKTQAANFNKQEDEEIAAAEQKAREEAERKRKEAIERRKASLKTETDLIRQAEDANLALLKDSAEKTKQQIKITADRQIEDLKKRLKEETNLTKAAKEAIKKMIKDIETKSINDQKAVDELATKEALDRETKAQDERLNLS